MLRQFKLENPNATLNPVQKSLLYRAQLEDQKAAQAAKAGKAPNGLTPSNTGRPGSTPAGSGSFGGVSGGAPGQFPGSPAGSFSGAATAPPPSTPGAGPLIPSQLPQTTEKPKPIVIESFAKDEQGKGTAEALTKAEDLMKDGKFTSALEQYDLVEQIAPKNPFALLGRANAELGASYYGLAESHLREAFMGDHPLLMAQYDLNKFLGADRLQILVKDLKQIALSNPTQSRPLFLLSYIAYKHGRAKQGGCLPKRG